MTIGSRGYNNSVVARDGADVVFRNTVSVGGGGQPESLSNSLYIVGGETTFTINRDDPHPATMGLVVSPSSGNPINLGGRGANYVEVSDGAQLIITNRHSGQGLLIVGGTTNAASLGSTMLITSGAMVTNSANTLIGTWFGHGDRTWAGSDNTLVVSNASFHNAGDVYVGSNNAMNTNAMTINSVIYEVVHLPTKNNAFILAGEADAIVNGLVIGNSPLTQDNRVSISGTSTFTVRGTLRIGNNGATNSQFIVEGTGASTVAQHLQMTDTGRLIFKLGDERVVDEESTKLVITGNANLADGAILEVDAETWARKKGGEVTLLTIAGSLNGVKTLHDLVNAMPKSPNYDVLVVGDKSLVLKSQRKSQTMIFIR